MAVYVLLLPSLSIPRMLVRIIPEVNCVSSLPPVRARASEERAPWEGGAADAINTLLKAGLLTMLRGEKAPCRSDAEMPWKTVEGMVAVVSVSRFGKVLLCCVDNRRVGCKGLSLGVFEVSRLQPCRVWQKEDTERCMDAAFMQKHPRHRTNPLFTHLDTQRRCEQNINSIDNAFVQEVVLGQRNVLSRFGRMPLSSEAQSRRLRGYT
jgi:hypothetical protein